MAENVKITNRSKITRVYNKDGTCIETVVESCVRVPKGSLKHKQAIALEMLQKMVDDLEISWACANALATIIKNPKRSKWAKKITAKEYLTGKPHSELKFKRTMKTDANLLKVQKDLLANPAEYGIQDEQVEKLKKHFTSQCIAFIYDYPAAALRSPTLRSMLYSSKRALKLWYASYTKSTEIEVREKPIDGIISFLASELKHLGLYK